MDNIDPLIQAISKAFETRTRPCKVLAMPIAGDDVPAGHPGFGKGDPIPYNHSDFIIRNIEGKTWRDVKAEFLTYTIYYFSLEALCYYLPAILIHNLRFGHEIESVDLFLTDVRSMQAERVLFRDALNDAERNAVADFLAASPQIYTADDVRFWRGFDADDEQDLTNDSDDYLG